MNKIKIFYIILVLFFSQNSLANDGHGSSEHGGQIFHSFTLESEIGESRNGHAQIWDFDGWIGGDYNKLYLKSEGERKGSQNESSEFQALYSRNIARFWDVQIGVRHNFEPRSTNYLTIGFEGLAPYFFDTEAYIFYSDDRDFSFRIRQEKDLLITQKLITQPYYEANFYAQKVSELGVKSGLAEIEIGLETRYEIVRKFAPYFAIRYERKTFGTADLARKQGDRTDDFTAAIGLKLIF